MVDLGRPGKLLRHAGWAFRAVARYGIPRRVISYSGGLGDDLLCGTVAHELRRRGAGRIWVATHFTELFIGNPDLRAVSLADWRYGAFGRLLGIPTTPLWYTRYEPESDRDPEPARHFIAMMCEKAGITGRIALRPYLYLSDAERRAGRVAPRQIALQSSALGASTPLANKEWYVERMQAVVDGLRDRYTFVQIGVATDPKLKNVIDVAGKTNVRQAAAILSESRAFVGLASGLMHVARAVDCPSVIVYGGRERPEISGYVCNDNLTRNPPCSPCWKRNRCEYDRVCMATISADDVVRSVDRLLGRSVGDLAVEYVDL